MYGSDVTVFLNSTKEFIEKSCRKRYGNKKAKKNQFF